MQTLPFALSLGIAGMYTHKFTTMHLESFMPCLTNNKLTVCNSSHRPLQAQQWRVQHAACKPTAAV